MNMSLAEPIGGYFGLELPKEDNNLFKNSILLNSARNCLAYILKAHLAKRLFMPIYTCDVLVEPLNELGVEVIFYKIDESLRIAQDITFQDNDYLLYTNYFGIMDGYVKQLSNNYKDSLIIDCAQALY